MSVKRCPRPTVKTPATALDRECRDIFNLVSADGGRTIPASELDAALCLLGVKSPGPAQLEALLLEVDPRWRNEITFSRFRAAVRKIDNGATTTSTAPPPTKSGAGSSPSASRAATAPAGAAKQSVGMLLKGSTKPRWRMPTLGWGASAPPHRRDDPTSVRSSSRGARLTTEAVTDAWRLHCHRHPALGTAWVALRVGLGLRVRVGVRGQVRVSQGEVRVSARVRVRVGRG